MKTQTDIDQDAWIDQHQPDPRLPTNPEYVEVRALAEQYQVSADLILDLALTRPGSCLHSGGNPWLEHDPQDESLFFHEPTLRASLASHSR